jgi:hypothetical protein
VSRLWLSGRPLLSKPLIVPCLITMSKAEHCVQTAILVAEAGALVELLSHRWPPASTCVYFALWAVVTAARTLWASLCEAPSSFAHGALPAAAQRAVSADQWQAVVATAAEAQALGAPTLAFLAHALAAVPVLVLGLALLEGALHKVEGSCCCSTRSRYSLLLLDLGSATRA